MYKSTHLAARDGHQWGPAWAAASAVTVVMATGPRPASSWSELADPGVPGGEAVRRPREVFLTHITKKGC